MMRAGITILIIAASLAAPVAIPAQTLSGTLIAEDTGAPIGGATVVAIQRTASHTQRPAISKAVAIPPAGMR